MVNEYVQILPKTMKFVTPSVDVTLDFHTEILETYENLNNETISLIMENVFNQIKAYVG